MPGNYTLRRTYVVGDDLLPTDYNADHQQHIDNQTPIATDDYSSDVTQFRSIADTGDVSSEVLPTTLAGELEQLRYTIKHIKSVISASTVSQWYSKSYSVVVPNSSITASKLANGATFIQAINDHVGPIGVTTNTTLVSRAITTTRSRVRIGVHVTAQALQTGVGVTNTDIELLRDGGLICHDPGGCVEIAVGQTATVAGGFTYIDTPGIGPHTYLLRMTKTNAFHTVTAHANMTLEEIA